MREAIEHLEEAKLRQDTTKIQQVNSLAKQGKQMFYL
jgi:hypothetical protein